MDGSLWYQWNPVNCPFQGFLALRISVVPFLVLRIGTSELDSKISPLTIKIGPIRILGIELKTACVICIWKDSPNCKLVSLQNRYREYEHRLTAPSNYFKSDGIPVRGVFGSTNLDILSRLKW